MHDPRVDRIQKMLAANTRMLIAIAAEAESLSNQTLADDIHRIINQHQDVYEEFCVRGRRYGGLRTPVRIRKIAS